MQQRSSADEAIDRAHNEVAFDIWVHFGKHFANHLGFRSADIFPGNEEIITEVAFSDQPVANNGECSDGRQDKVFERFRAG